MALVYVGIALALLGQVAAYSIPHVQYFDSLARLDLQARDVIFLLHSQPSIVVYASVRNPTGYAGLKIESVTYTVFVNSTSDPSGPVGAGSGTTSYASNPPNIPPNNDFNITTTIPPYTVLGNFTTFVVAHAEVQQRFVSIIVVLLSPFGLIQVPYCYEFPRRIFTICPSLLIPYHKY